MNDLNDSNVPARVPRIKRIISPAQEGLLDTVSDGDAPKYVEALKWVHRVASDSVAGGASADSAGKLHLIESLTAWINDVALEKQGLTTFDGKVIRFEDLPDDY